MIGCTTFIDFLRHVRYLQHKVAFGYMYMQESNGGVPEQELQRRTRKFQDSISFANNAEDQVRAAADAVITSRKRRDDELTAIARQLQVWEASSLILAFIWLHYDRLMFYAHASCVCSVPMKRGLWCCTGHSKP
jgi:hypothetical protein